jgi:hypothetical protein
MILVNSIVPESSSLIKMPENKSQKKCGLAVSFPIVSIAFARKRMIDTTIP